MRVVIVTVPVVVAYLVGLGLLPTPHGMDGRLLKRRAHVIDAQAALTACASLEAGIDVVAMHTSATASPGARVTLPLEFVVNRDVLADWKVFVHIDAHNAERRIQADHWPMNGEFPTSSWRRGDRLRDVVSVTVPRDAARGAYDVWVGFYRGDERMRVRHSDDGRHDGNNRIRIGQLELE